MKNEEMATEDEIVSGVVFKSWKGKTEPTGVKTKAKKKGYVTGQHGSSSAKKKADIRKRRANRPSQRKG